MPISTEPRISVIIHTYNAEKYLERVLDSVKRFDEIIIADMESTDSTLDIARKAGATIITYPKKNYNYPEVYRQAAIESARYDWILVVDADELIPDELREFLHDDIRKNPEPHGFSLPRKNFFMGKWMKCYYPDYILRFFHRDGTTWAPHIHSLPKIKGPVTEIPKKRTDLAIIHLANESYYVSIDKMNKYTNAEMERRRSRYKRINMFLQPPVRFFKAYVLKGGFRLGMPGFIHAVMDSFYRFSILAKLEEERQAQKKTDIDRYIH